MESQRRKQGSILLVTNSLTDRESNSCFTRLGLSSIIQINRDTVDVGSDVISFIEPALR